MQLRKFEKPLYPLLIQSLQRSQPCYNAPYLFANLIVISND